MPNIPVYDNPDNALNPSDRGSAAMETAARRVAGLGRESAQDIGSALTDLGKSGVQVWQNADDATTHKEVAQGALQSAVAENQLMEGFKQKVAEARVAGQDVSAVAHDFLTNQVAPWQDNFAGAFTTKKGQEWAQQHAATTAVGILHQVTALTSASQGAATVDAITGVVNTRAAIAKNTPGSLDQQIALTRQGIAGIVGTAPQTTEQITHTAGLERAGVGAVVRGYINGEVQRGASEADVQALTSKYSQWLTEPQQQEAQQHQQAHTLMQQHQDEINRQNLVRAHTQVIDADLANLYSRTIPATGGTPVLPPDYLQRVGDIKDKALAFGDVNVDAKVKTAIDFQQQIRNEIASGAKPITDQAKFNDFTSRMFMPPGDPATLTEQEIFAARAHGQLSDHDFTFLREGAAAAANNPQMRADKQQFDTVIAGLKRFITTDTITAGGLVIPDSNPQTTQRWGEYQHDMFQQFIARRQAGETADAILKSLPNQVTRYQIQNSISKTPNIAPLPPVGTPPAPPQLRATVPIAPKAPAAPIKPGESAADYFKRVGAH